MLNLKHHRNYRPTRRAFLIVSFALPVGVTLANEPRIEITRRSIDGGSQLASSVGDLELSSTIGQPAAGTLSAGGIELTSGFWFPVSLMDCDEDGSVAYLDNRQFLDCVTGPGQATADSCLCFDVNTSQTVDLLDWSVLQREFNDATAAPGDPAFTNVTGVVKMAGSGGDAVIGAVVELIGQGQSTITSGDGGLFFSNASTESCIVDVVATANVNGEDLFGAARFVKTVGGGTTDVGTITLSNVIRWVQPASGMWKDAVNWEPFFVPSQGKAVEIDVPDADITVTHDDDVPFDGPFDALTCNERLRLDRGTLSVDGSFQMNNTLDLVGGTLANSTVNLGTEGLINVLCQSDLDGVIINGNMDVLINSQGVRINNRLTINGDVRIGGFTGSAATGMFFLGPDPVLKGVGTVAFVANPSDSTIIQSGAGNLHVEAGITIRGAEGRIGRSDSPLVLDGLVHSNAAGTLQVRGSDCVNNGTLRASGAGSELWARGSWTSHGTIEADSDGRLILGDDGLPFLNLGSLSASGADVRLNSDFTIADLGAFDFDDSLVVIEGTLQNGTNLVLDAGQFNWKLGCGIVVGGTISSADGTTLDLVSGLGCSNAGLDGVTLNADMRMPQAKSADIVNGLTLNGTIRMDAFNAISARIDVLGPTRTINGTGSIEFASTGSNDVF
jgi:hypothetical protein